MRNSNVIDVNFIDKKLLFKFDLILTEKPELSSVFFVFFAVLKV